MTPPTKRLSQPEFIALIAMNFAMVAFSIDSMLPALPEIAEALTPDAPNRAQLVLTSFVFGMGVGTLFTGPLSDTFGRKTVIGAGALLYLIGAALAGRAETLEGMLAGRVLQGLGVAGPRVVAIAIVRDLYEGRPMARIMSYAMMVFTLVPALAPLLGSFIIDAFGWRAVFYSFLLFCCLVIGWLMIRQPETLPPERRRSFAPAALIEATRVCFSHRVFVLSTAMQVLAFGMLFGCLSSVQQIFETSFGRAETFELWFALIALISGSASVINAQLVVRLGMQRMITIGFGMQVAFSAMVLLLALFGAVPFGLYIVWTTSLFFMAGLVIGNLNALAMEPVGDIAGLAASVLGAVATVLGAMIAAPIGLAFDGTPLPLAMATATLSAIGLFTVFRGLR
ncbi:DHA1 family bicyclomycin/chloramphenicol resistance-like MFS transporter [Litoreibacter ponti]|uniref:DHA1 family bicyclomycin/chloramphenicol resistance-like MFS transporter n=1 Tax=Litoreibacter ponti TaxID=1510457 RepID=A0A2T6BIT4_9RHOB|nr:multidrug effflux MFS transporter [Litoreibacter ponti]PTX55980.1 DHA1 family bicyclomycin/chloramphenicol resistance-like MFS transporter [Litoreibacter ponti]